MSKYDEVYYIAERPYGENQLFVKADQKTAERGYHYKKVPLGEAPFFFYYSNKERDLKHGSRWSITDILMVGSNLLVSDSIRQELMKYDIEGMQLYPSVYMDDEDTWHEKFWFLSFYEKFTFFDRDKSVIRTFDDKDEDENYLTVRKYSLDEEKLDKIPEEKRLIFKMGGASLSYIFVHQKIVDFIENNEFKGVRFFKVSKFKEGIQYRP